MAVAIEVSNGKRVLIGAPVEKGEPLALLNCALPLFRSTETAPDTTLWLTTMSILPSPFMSAAAIACGEDCPTGTGLATWNVRLSLPSSTLTLLSLKFSVATSGFPSPLRSAMATPMLLQSFPPVAALT
jgi:hypothetical protein